jgi:hypothetical protein
MQVGEATIEWSDTFIEVEGESLQGVKQRGSVNACQISLRDGGLLEVGLTQWENNERDVRTFSRLSGPEIYDRLTKGVRMGVHPLNKGLMYSELRILSQHEGRQPTMIKAHETDLNRMLDGSVRDFLLGCGADRVGTREEIFSDESRRREYLAVSFFEDNFQAPIVAYTITRILPLFKGFGNMAPIPVGQA